jgi:hypothetical protein
MKINGKEISLLPKRLAVELYWTKKAEDVMNFGSSYYEAFDLALMIWASAANWSKVNLKPKQIEFEEVLDFVETVSDEAAKEVSEFCKEFIDSNFFKEKTEKIQAIVDEEIKKKSLTGKSLESNVIKRASKRKNTTV